MAQIVVDLGRQKYIVVHEALEQEQNFIVRLLLSIVSLRLIIINLFVCTCVCVCLCVQNRMDFPNTLWSVWTQISDMHSSMNPKSLLIAETNTTFEAHKTREIQNRQVFGMPPAQEFIWAKSQNYFSQAIAVQLGASSAEQSHEAWLSQASGTGSVQSIAASKSSKKRSEPPAGVEQFLDLEAADSSSKKRPPKARKTKAVSDAASSASSQAGAAEVKEKALKNYATTSIPLACTVCR
jgi:hypothetical protein